MGPVLVVELAEAVCAWRIERLRAFLVGSSSPFEEYRLGEYDLNIRAAGLTAMPPGVGDSCPPVMVSLVGPGFGGESPPETEHHERGDPAPHTGFTPTHAAHIIAFCDNPVDHVVTALLAAEVMDVIGGVANAQLPQSQAPIVAGPPGVVATLTSPWPVARGLRLGGVPQSVGARARVPAHEVTGVRERGVPARTAYPRGWRQLRQPDARPTDRGFPRAPTASRAQGASPAVSAER